MDKAYDINIRSLYLDRCQDSTAATSIACTMYTRQEYTQQMKALQQDMNNLHVNLFLGVGDDPAAASTDTVLYVSGHNLLTRPLHVCSVMVLPNC